MGVFYESIPKSLSPWILKQHCFWVSTAPLSSQGHVNLSPKGGAYFGLIDERTFWYMELSGSGSETVSHLYESGNGRITVLFNAFEGPPRILRLYGHGKVLENLTPEFNEFVKEHGVQTIPGTRTIIIVDVHQVGTSCGFSVPYYDFKEHRPILNDFYAKKAEKFAAGNEKESMERYWALKNAYSVDGLPSMKIGLKTGKTENITPIKKMVGLPSPMARNPSSGFSIEHVFFVALLSALLSAFVALYGPRLLKEIMAAIPSDAKSIITSPMETLR